MSVGKHLRLQRLMNGTSHRTVIVPMDHGVTAGVPDGLENISDAVRDMICGGADAVLMHKGSVRSAADAMTASAGLIMHLSASTSFDTTPPLKTLVATVEEAIRLGADAVSVHINLGNDDEPRMLDDFGRISAECETWGMPLLAMVYARGPRVADGNAPHVIAHCARIGAEMGADIVKVPYTGSRATFQTVVEQCPVPVVIAGGDNILPTQKIIEHVYDAVHAGAAGISMGRPVFGHPHRTELVRALCGIVHRGLTPEEAFKTIGTLT